MVPTKTPTETPTETLVKPSSHLRRRVRCSLKGAPDRGGECKGRVSGHLSGRLSGHLSGRLSGSVVECFAIFKGCLSSGRASGDQIKATERESKTQIFAGNRRFSQIQRESNMHRTEVHHFASPFAPKFPVGENSGFLQEIL